MILIYLRPLDRFQLRLGYVVAVSIAHQGTCLRISSLFIILYIIRLIRRMDILEGCMVGGLSSMSLKTLRSMGMMRHTHIARGLTTMYDDLQILLLLLNMAHLLPDYSFHFTSISLCFL